MNLGEIDTLVHANLTYIFFQIIKFGLNIIIMLFSCSACVPKLAEKKHRFIAHKLLVCECEQELTQVCICPM